MNKFPERLAYLRKIKGITLKELSEELAVVKEASISRYENGRREPKMDLIIKIADYFNCSADYLLGRTDQIYKLNYKIENNEINLEEINKAINTLEGIKNLEL
ncbi:helix-turn-helix transcriptional regulator [Halanaerobiaceae bacterium Z-7014]|uniref:Helix-turn-helix transcriptional regulator n=1 Tax=Halonatronomonas betaini TaxID=2778430 RepID=A0A931F867_9FIRM|nr:helix-turn-helix transcriptional regulator [Halonatronomonas betaini]MBF8436213.1 helix-turn-helix transcriptional regulator [Halonatronomonas betaini]